MEQLNLFTEELITSLEVGSMEWRLNRFNELSRLSFDELEKIEDAIDERYCIKNRWFNDFDYYTSLVIVDIYHSVKLEEFKKRYPKALVYYRVPPYLQ